MEITMFAANEKFSGRTNKYNSVFDVQADIQLLKELKEAIREPQILCYTGLECINFSTKSHDSHFIGEDSIEWLYATKCEETGTVNDMRACILKCSTEDKEWTQKRNEGLSGVFFRKITFLPEIKELLINKYEEYLQELTAMLEQMKKTKKKEKEEKAARRSEWSLVKEYTHIKPSGGENGRDGYIDADYQNAENGAIVRMVSRDVYDVGCYSYPKRLEGAENVSDSLTEDEKNLTRWLAEFGEFKKVRM